LDFEGGGQSGRAGSGVTASRGRLGVNDKEPGLTVAGGIGHSLLHRDPSMPPLFPINLYSDNVAVAAPEIMAALARVNAGPAQPYGQDAETHAMKIAFSDLFGTEVWVMPVSTGTAANAIALSALTPPFGTILCSDVAHVETSECGATEMFSGGAKLTRVPSKAGQMSADVLDEVIRKAGKGLQHRSQPAAVNLTIGTERGTAYPVNDIARIAEVAKKHGLHFHIDGARLANALIALGTSARSVTTDLGVDVLSFGATKNGTLNTEAIVVFRKQIAEELRYRLRRAGQVWSKMRYSAAQLNAYIEAGLWLRLATQANTAAKRLSEGLSQVPGIRMIERVEMNLLFMQMPEKIIAGLEADGIGLGRRDEGVRMVTAWSTTTEEVDHVVHRAKLHASKVR
jgi:threonine aldolase